MITSEADCLQLLHRIAQRDEVALAELYDGTRMLLGAYIRRFIRDVWVAEEVLQDVYRGVWTNAAAYQRDRGAPAAWLYTIARSRALDRLRQGRNDAPNITVPYEPHRAPRRDAEQEQFTAFESALVRRTVDQLPPAQREVVRLAFFEGYSHSEIADETGLPLGTVKARIRIALNRLRGKLNMAIRGRVAAPAV